MGFGWLSLSTARFSGRNLKKYTVATPECWEALDGILNFVFWKSFWDQPSKLQMDADGRIMGWTAEPLQPRGTTPSSKIGTGAHQIGPYQCEPFGFWSSLTVFRVHPGMPSFKAQKITFRRLRLVQTCDGEQPKDLASQGCCNQKKNGITTGSHWCVQTQLQADFTSTSPNQPRDQSLVINSLTGNLHRKRIMELQLLWIWVTQTID